MLTPAEMIAVLNSMPRLDYTPHDLREEPGRDEEVSEWTELRLSDRAERMAERAMWGDAA